MPNHKMIIPLTMQGAEQAFCTRTPVCMRHVVAVVVLVGLLVSGHQI
jgi:hypothetical protein